MFSTSDSCDKIKCPYGMQCLVDQNLSPHCVNCLKECSDTPKRRVCGADGQTYPSACHLRQKTCREGKAIPIAYKGPCRGEYKNIFASLQYLNIFSSLTNIGSQNFKIKNEGVQLNVECFAEGATCETVRCQDRQSCLIDFTTKMPRCVSCTSTCRPRHMHGPICGTNNNTYHSWCEMVSDSCAKGYIINTKHPGKCVRIKF